MHVLIHIYTFFSPADTIFPAHLSWMYVELWFFCTFKYFLLPFSFFIFFSLDSSSSGFFDFYHSPGLS